MSRIVRWTRTERRPDLHDGINTLADLGIEQVHGEPLYDNGTYFVIDSVRDLSFVVCRMTDGYIHQYRQIDLDKYEAIRVADELLESENRNGALT